MGIDPLTLITLIAIPIYAVGAALIAFVLFFVVRLAVRFGMRDHYRWAQQQPDKGHAVQYGSAPDITSPRA